MDAVCTRHSTVNASDVSGGRWHGSAAEQARPDVNWLRDAVRVKSDGLSRGRAGHRPVVHSALSVSPILDRVWHLPRTFDGFEPPSRPACRLSLLSSSSSMPFGAQMRLGCVRHGLFARLASSPAYHHLESSNYLYSVAAGRKYIAQIAMILKKYMIFR